MSDDQNGLSDDEYDALLQDLEGRAGDDGGGGDIDDDIGDIDEFLASAEMEADDGPSTTTATAQDDDLAAQFSTLEEKGELTAPEQSTAQVQQSSSSEGEVSTGGKQTAGAQGRSRGAKAALFVAKNLLWAIPAGALWWVLGVYLAQWVSAGWLIAAVATAVVVTIPLALRGLVNRGAYRVWLAGVSLVLTVALVAPIPNLAGQNMAHYGHWPSSTIAQLMPTQPADAGFVTAHATATGWLGATVSPDAPDAQIWEARQLGTVFPLDMEWPPDPDEVIPLLEGDGEIQEVDQPPEETEVDQPPEETEELDDGDEQVEADAPEAGDDSSAEAVDEAAGETGDAVEEASEELDPQ